MGCIIRSWNLVILFVVTGDVAMAYPSDDVDARSMVEDHSEVRGVDTNKPQLFEHIRKEPYSLCDGKPGCTVGTFKIGILFGLPKTGASTDGDIFVLLEFEGNKRWSAYKYVIKNVSNGGYKYGYVHDEYYGSSYGVTNVYLYNDCETDCYFPIYVQIEGPGGNFNCGWSNQCSSGQGVITEDCYIHDLSAAISCRPVS